MLNDDGQGAMNSLGRARRKRPVRTRSPVGAGPGLALIGQSGTRSDEVTVGLPTQFCVPTHARCCQQEEQQELESHQPRDMAGGPPAAS